MAVPSEESGGHLADDANQDKGLSCVTVQLIIKRHLPTEAKNWDEDQIYNALCKITHLRLDRENIGVIDNMELLSPAVTNVYLQQNCIRKIENFECLCNIQFLTLAGNQIRTVENLSCLSKLAFLDLSDNLINSFDIDEFPQFLIILNLRGNSCISLPDYRRQLIHVLSHLRQLDGIDVSKQERLEVGYTVSSSTESEEDKEEDARDLESITRELLKRNQIRVEERMKEFEKRFQDLDGIRLRSNLPLACPNVLTARSSIKSSRSEKSVSTPLKRLNAD